MTPIRLDFESRTPCIGGGSAVDISQVLMGDGDGTVGPRAEFSTNPAATSSYHIVARTPLSPPLPPRSQCQEFLQFKTQAEKLVLLATTKLCPEDRQRASAFWNDLGKKLSSHSRNHHHSTSRSRPGPDTAPVPSTSTAATDKSGFTSTKPGSPGAAGAGTKHFNANVSPSLGCGRRTSVQASSPSGSRTMDHVGVGAEVRRNLEADLGPAEELVLQSTAIVNIAPDSTPMMDLIESLSRNGPIRMMDENPDGELVLSSSSSSSNTGGSLIESEHSIFEDPSATWKCKHCPAIFHDWITFQNHKPSHKKTYKCDQCDIVYTTKGNLNVHRRTHSGEKPFVCSKCAARFSNSGNLRRHMLTHQGLKPYNCSVCNSKFTEKKSLLIHQRSRHTGERPYVCPDCGQGFSQSSILNSHRLIHSNEKPFCCLKCGHKFRQKSQLTLHEKRHAGLKNFSCSYSGCTAAFVTKADLDRHARSHEGSKIPCEVCGRTFMRKHTLKNHMKSQHS